jgi:hypothetical protein
VLMRTLKGRPPMSDAFGRGGRVWLAELELPADERETVDGCLRQIDFLDAEIAILERAIADHALHSDAIKRLMTVPGVSLMTATTFIAAVGDIRRFAGAYALLALPRVLSVDLVDPLAGVEDRVGVDLDVGGLRRVHPRSRRGTVPLRRGRTVGGRREAPAVRRHVSFRVLRASAAWPGSSRAASLTTWS